MAPLPSETAGPTPKVTDRRYPRWVFARGNEPDPRFSLANERTFLAWIRTSLALIAAGVALEVVTLPVPHVLHGAVGVLLIGLGLVCPVQAWIGWAATERSLRLARPLAPGLLTPVVALGSALAGAMLLIGALVGSAAA